MHVDMGMAAFIFATGFSSVKLPGRALAFNLFGALIGALLEGLSMLFGINAMVILAGLLYLGSFLCILKVIKNPAAST